jgi:hypothetical protein
MNSVRALFVGVVFGLSMEAALWIGIESSRWEYQRGLDAGHVAGTDEALQESFRHGYQCGFKDGQPKKVELEIVEEKPVP